MQVVKVTALVVILGGFIHPSLDGTYYGMVMSVRPSVQGFLLIISFSFHILS
jgi:hypothetical protein